MNTSELSVGSVLQCEWDERPIRVLVHDEVELHYDAWLPHRQAWGLTLFGGKVNYYRLPTTMLGRCRPLREEPLSEAERAMHRPDLPLRFARDARLQWTATQYPSPEAYAAHVAAAASPALLRQLSEFTLPVSRIMLVPFGPKGAAKPARPVEAGHARGLTALYVLWHAHNLQAKHAPGPPPDGNGVGIYRLGLQGGAPSFYLWGERDQPGFAPAIGGDPG